MHFLPWHRLFFVLACLLSTPLLSQTRRVVTYIEDVQEERKSTRWTLTEWLKIKERMKLMDVWLAMFSDPKKNKFAPELSLNYSKGKGLSLFKYGDLENFSQGGRAEQMAPHTIESGRLQFWFTNLVSSTTGLRTLDVDLGLEANFTNRFMLADQTLAPGSLPALSSDTEKLQLGGLNLRLFGANEQDSSLVAKAGKFNRSSGFELSPFASSSGSYYGGEMALYFLNWFGLEGRYLVYKPSVSGDDRAGASSSETTAFIEIYNLRIGYGQYQQDWQFESQGLRLDTRDTGRQLTVKLYF